MPAGPRIRANNAYGITTDNPLGAGATTYNSTQLILLPAVSSAHSIVVLDPKRVFGQPEIVVVTAHTGLSTSATITRAAYGTLARSHPVGTVWAHVAVDEDYIEILGSTSRPLDPYIGQSIYETDTLSHKHYDGFVWNSAPPVGSLLPFLGGVAPSGYLLANGAAISRTVYADLFAVVGTLYGVGDGITTFNLPNLNGRIPVGRDAGQAEFDVLGDIGGQKTHALTIAEVPTHSHGITDVQHNHTQNSHGHGNDAHDHSIDDDHEPAHRHMDDLGFNYVWRAGGVQNDYLTSGADPNKTVGVTFTEHRLAGDHNHDIDGSNIPITIQGFTATNQANFSNLGGTNSAGSSTPVVGNNLQPFIVVNYIVKF